MNGDQPRGLTVCQRTKDDTVDHAEDGGVRPYYGCFEPIPFVLKVKIAA
jgi:hypothetical protein